MAGQRVAANLGAILGGAFHVDGIAHLVLAQCGDVQALLHHIKGGAGGREVFRHRQAYAIVRDAGANSQVLAKARGKFHGEGAQTILVAQRGNGCHGLNDAGKHGWTLFSAGQKSYFACLPGCRERHRGLPQRHRARAVSPRGCRPPPRSREGEAAQRLRG